MVFLNMDLTDAPKTMGFDPLPPGDYEAQIVDSGQTFTQNDGYAMLSLTWQVCEGEHAGHLLFDRSMLTGSDKAVKFGQRKLGTIATAVGHSNPNRLNDSEELHGMPCLIKMGLGKGDYADRNEIKDFLSLLAREDRAPAPAKNPAPSKNVAPQ